MRPEPEGARRVGLQWSRSRGQPPRRESSPYLLQHADNPVDWYPWGAEAFARAEAEDKPIFLSIGYSTCHWCHVMEQRVLRDRPGSREALNRDFVSIKVDREERPDVDDIYMPAVQMMTGQRRLAHLALPDAGRQALLRRHVLPADRRAGAGPASSSSSPRSREALEDAARRARDLRRARCSRTWRRGPQRRLARARASLPGPDLLDTAVRPRSRRFDPVDGGFGGAPKFPPVDAAGAPDPALDAHGRPEARAMIEKTLDGWPRAACTTRSAAASTATRRTTRWLVPHFEKMLYDNALARAELYTEASAPPRARATSAWPGRPSTSSSAR